MKLLPLLERALAGERPEGMTMMLPPPVAQLIGFEGVSLGEGTAVFRLKAERAKHANPMGTLHGGIICDLADGTMGMACATLLEVGESFTTIDLKINFFRPVIDGVIEARAKVINAGKTLVYLECDVVTVPEGKLVAKVSSTCTVLRGERAKGR